MLLWAGDLWFPHEGKHKQLSEICSLLFSGFCCFGIQIDEDLVREIMKHKSLHHPNVIRFKEVSE